MHHMESYGEVWYEDIGRYYFNQEYWYLLVSVMVHYWRGELMNVGDACACMKTGSVRTREARLRRLLDANWIEKSKTAPDKRQTCVLPTRDMQRIVGAHLRRSLIEAARFAHKSDLFDAVEPLIGTLETTGDTLNRTHLLPWAEFLVEYTDDWNATFDNRFHTEEYWHPFVHCLLAFWAARPLTIGEACQTMRTGIEPHAREPHRHCDDAGSAGQAEDRHGSSDLAGAAGPRTGELPGGAFSIARWNSSGACWAICSCADGRMGPQKLR